MFSTTVKPSLSLFCSNISGGNRVFCYGHNNGAWFPHPHFPLKAGYSAHSTQLSPGFTLIGFRVSLTHRNTGSSLIRTGSAHLILAPSKVVPHKNRSPRKQGRDLHAIGERPENASAATPHFPPAPTPNWAFEAGTRGFKDVPFKGFLGPSW